MGNNFMDEECGKLFEEATRYNQTLIDFEFGFNNFHLEHVYIAISYLPCFRLEKFKTT